MLPDIHRATQKFYIFLIVYLTGCTPIQTAATKVTTMLYLASGVRLLCSLTNHNFVLYYILEE